MFRPVIGHANGIMALLALGLGYIVCSLAKKEQGSLKVIGYIIGAAIIAASSLLIIGKVLFTAKICAMKKSGIMPSEQMLMPKVRPPQK